MNRRGTAPGIRRRDCRSPPLESELANAQRSRRRRSRPNDRSPSSHHGTSWAHARSRCTHNNQRPRRQRRQSPAWEGEDRDSEVPRSIGIYTPSGMRASSSKMAEPRRPTSRPWRPWPADARHKRRCRGHADRPWPLEASARFEADVYVNPRPTWRFIMNGSDFGRSYFPRTSIILNHQLARAGVRLAKLLNARAFRNEGRPRFLWFRQ